MNCWRQRYGFSLAEKTGGTAIGLAILLGLIDPRLACLPLGLFLAACLCAPFCPQWSFFLPLISRGCANMDGIALTFDDGPCPASTPLLLSLLAQYQFTATFFVIGKKAEAYPELIQAILEQGHSIGNHSYRHDPFLMLRSCTTLAGDIRAAQEVLKRSGVRPLLFRPPVGITNSRLKPVLEHQGLQAITFSCRVFDRGNRNIHNLAAKVRSHLKSGDILLLHDNPPAKAEAAACWHQELDTMFADINRNFSVVPLADFIGRPVMGDTPQG